MPASKYEAIIADPFGADPVGIPDLYAGKTAAFRINQTQLLDTPTGVPYTGCIIKADGLNTSVVQTLASNSAGNTLVATNVPLVGYSDFLAHYKYWRPVSLGVKVYYTGQESLTAGTITVGAIPGGATYLDLPADFDDWFTIDGCHTAAVSSLTGPLVIACHSYDAPRFGAWTTTSNNSFFPTAFVMGAGLPVTTSGLIRIEFSLCIEAIPLHGSVLAGHHAVAVPPDSNAMDQGHRRIGAIRTGAPEEVIMSTSLKRSSTRQQASRAKRVQKSRSRATGPSGKALPVIYQGSVGRRRVMPLKRKRRRTRTLYRRR